MDLPAIAEELYGLPLGEFTAARNARAAAVRDAGDRQLAQSVRKLRKPSTGASVTNLLVRERSREIERLIGLGAKLRQARVLDGALMRRATQEKAQTVNSLLKHARSIATRSGSRLSQSTEQEIEATLDAAFSDPSSAQSLREGCLTNALHYSGLGLGADGKVRDEEAPPRGPVRVTSDGLVEETAKATLRLQQARSAESRAESEVQKAQRAVGSAEAELKQLHAALRVATRRATRAREMALAAEHELASLRDKEIRP